MPSKPRLFKENTVHHVYNRGIQKMTIFHSDEDFERFLNKMREYKVKYGVEILAWAVMPNHFHLALRSTNLKGHSNISSFMQQLQNAYAKYYALKHEFSGRLFQGTFKSKLVNSDTYLIQLLHYIHNQAQHHQIAKNFEWPYSSLSEYLSIMRHPLAITEPDPDILDIGAYKEMFAEYQETFVEEFDI